MKQIYLMLLFLVIFASYAPPEPVEIPDPNLASIQEVLNLDEDKSFKEKERIKIENSMQAIGK